MTGDSVLAANNAERTCQFGPCKNKPMNRINRRQAMMATLALPLARTQTAATPAGGQALKLSLAAYSLRKYLEIKSGRQELTLFQFAELCADWGLGSVEVTSYFVPDTSSGWLRRFKRHLTRLGLEVSGTAVGNDFCLAEDAKRAAEVAKVKKWIEISAYLGAKTIRVFAGNVPKGDTEDAARRRCQECLQAVADFAPQHGVVVAVENHGGITARPEQLLQLIDGVRHEWLGVNLDTANFHTVDPYASIAQVASQAVVVQMKSEIQPSGQKKQPADFRRLLEIVRAASYRGYVVLEYEGDDEPKSAVPLLLEQLRALLALR